MNGNGRVLVVTEDPSFVEEVRSKFGGVRQIVACLGPAQRSCLMDRYGMCSLAEHSEFVLVDSPATGAFNDHYHGIPAISYAERLAETHPRTEVIMCDPLRHGEGPSAFLSRQAALQVIEEESPSGDPRGEIDEGS